MKANKNIFCLIPLRNVDTSQKIAHSVINCSIVTFPVDIGKRE